MGEVAWGGGGGDVVFFFLGLFFFFNLGTEMCSYDSPSLGCSCYVTSLPSFLFILLLLLAFNA